MESENEEEKIEEVEKEVIIEEVEKEVRKTPRKSTPKPKQETRDLKVLIITDSKIIGSTKEGHGYAVPKSEEYKDVKVGDTITVKK
jgi:hypothetical protein